MMRHNYQSGINWKRILDACLLSTILWLASTPMIRVEAASGGVQQESASVSVNENQPFARVYLALQGCTSCAACRSVIRQMTKGAASEGKVSLPTDAVEIQYAEPATIPLKKVVGNLARNRLHNLKLVDVLFDASGRISTAEDGSTQFTIVTTGQQYAISFPENLNAPSESQSLRISAVVQGWRGKGSELSLKLKSFTVID